VIRGQVTADREAVVLLTVRGPQGDEMEVETVADTGFTGSLTLPLLLISTLALPYQNSTPAILADGSVVMCDEYKQRLSGRDGRGSYPFTSHQAEPCSECLSCTAAE
jgi:predicted aspartyl protease